MQGFGGNFCPPRYRSTAPMDRGGERILQTLPVDYARVGIPLNDFHPAPGVFDRGPQAKASFEAMRRLKVGGRGLRIKFLIGDTANGRTLAPYADDLMQQTDPLPVLGPLAFHT
jgi:hypothetical protein